MVELKLRSATSGDRTVVSVQGEIDLYTAPRLHGELARLLADGAPRKIVVDMAGVEFCDSTGMNVLLAAHRRAREQGGDLELAGPRPTVQKILLVTGLESVFAVYNVVQDTFPRDPVLTDTVLTDTVLTDTVLTDTVLSDTVLDDPAALR